jgi:hypothetical protein
MEDFTAHPERHPLIQNPCRSQYGAMCTNLKAILQCKHEFPLVAYFDKWNEFRVHSMKHNRTIHTRYLNAAQRKPSRMKISRMSLFGRVYCPNV